MVSRAIGTIVERKTVTAGKEYTRVWIYIPKSVSGDSAFKFHVGDSCDIELNTKTGDLLIRPLSTDQARKLRWSSRKKTLGSSA